MSRSLDDKLDAAMLAILHEHPFYWTVLQKLRRRIISVEAELPGCQVAATDGFSEVVFNRENCEELTTEVLIGLFLHECQHVAHFHPMRCEGRDMFLWNCATDYAVNDLLFEEGLQLPEEALYEKAYEGMAPEEIYAQLQQDQEKEKQDDQTQQGGSGTGDQAGQSEGSSSGRQERSDGSNSGGEEAGSDRPDGGTGGSGSQDETAPGDSPGSLGGREPSVHGDPEHQEDSDGSPQGHPGGSGEGRQDGTTLTRMKVDWTHGDMMTSLANKWEDLPPEEKQDHKQKIDALRQRAVMIAQAAGKNLSSCEVSNNAAFTPRDWREHLRSFVMNQITREDYTWARPNRRFVPQGIYLPSLRGTNDPESIILAIDNSGSISQEKLEEFLEEIACIMTEMPTTIFHIICCDTRVNGYHKVSSSDLPLDFEVVARGGTRFTPVFDEVDERDIEPEALIYFTDMGSSDYPSQKPEYPVLWMNYGRILPSNKDAIRKLINKRKTEYKSYSYHGGVPDWSDAEWMSREGFPPFGEVTNMSIDKRKR